MCYDGRMDARDMVTDTAKQMRMRFNVWASEPETELTLAQATWPVGDEDRFACRCADPLDPTRSCPSHRGRWRVVQKYGRTLHGRVPTPGGGAWRR